MSNSIIISCEHASNAIPASFQELFKSHVHLLQSHRAYDIGALEVYEAFCSAIKPDYAIKGEYSRLLVELNRSLHHQHLFSSITKSLSKNEKEEILKTHYFPYRKDIEAQVASFLNKSNRVVHLSIHSFTPELNGVKRNADLAFLYDPGSLDEKDFCLKWKSGLMKKIPEIRIRMNYPYRGTMDGLTTHLRRVFPKNYLGIELEINNSLLPSKQWDKWQAELIKCFTELTISY